MQTKIILSFLFRVIAMCVLGFLLGAYIHPWWATVISAIALGLVITWGLNKIDDHFGVL